MIWGDDSLGAFFEGELGEPEAAREILFIGDMGDGDEVESNDELGVCEFE